MNVNLDYINIRSCRNLYRNLPVSELVKHALERNEGVLAENGALAINTGKYTGRSPKDRFIVKQDSIKNKVNWGSINIPIDEEVFTNLYNKVTSYLQNKDLFVFDGFAGAMKEYRIPIRVVCECAYQAMFSNQLFIRPAKDELENHVPFFTVISAPGFKACGAEDGVNSEAFIIINFDRKIILIGGTQYSGEIKKSIFSMMNFLMPLKGVFPMHCSANIGKDEDTAVFFGLSGTGKTTLSADPERKLIGDDEHGWCDSGIFNFEGGCYAKTIKLSRDKEKEIYDAVKFGTVLENVVLDEDNIPDYDDDSRTENTRAAYPVEFIENAELSGLGTIPKTAIFLTADAFGVMPPICKLTKEMAMYHFMSGYTSKVAGTERGIVEPVATFSACFGEPFMLMNPSVYAEMLGEKMEKYDTDVYMINTGWLSGGYGKGKRIKLSYTRAMVKAALEGKLKNVEYVEHPVFKVMMPIECPDVPSNILDPKNTWEDKEAYDTKAEELAQKFAYNFKKFKDVPEKIVNAGPRILNRIV
jgi:phosphoenolpyruvate carboxykinase (ATP)